LKVFLEPEFSSYYQQCPLVLVDVGSSGGVKSNWKLAEKYLQVIGFEPEDEGFDNLATQADSRVRYLNTGLYKEKATLDFHVTRENTDSSIFKPNRELIDKFPAAERFDIVKTETIRTDTLDNQLQENRIENVDFIKVDTQGSELFILQGANRVLERSVFGLEIEVEFAPMYEGQPLFSEVDSFVRGFGFQLFDLRPIYWKREMGRDYGNSKGQLIFADALYFRKSEDFGKVLNLIRDEGERKAKVIKAVSACLLYGYVDYAMEVFTSSEGLFSEGERQSFAERIKKDSAAPSLIPNFRGRARIARLLHALGRRVQPPYRDWRVLGSGRELGNL
jgi:FkbM family methyltransferase